MAAKHHHRCDLRGRGFGGGERRREHVERRHPKKDVHWWAVVEDPARDLQFSGEER